jgi:opacity protein-like surface antigen
MRTAICVIATAMVATLSGTAIAQTTSAPPPASTSAVTSGPTKSQWVASIFLASTIQTNNDEVLENSEGLVGYGAQFAWLWRGIIGPELYLDSQPHMDLDERVTQRFEEVSLWGFMGNALATYPLGSEGQFQPFLSGGYGMVNVGADELLVLNDPSGDSDSFSEGRGAWNIGAGLLAYASEHVGIRTDFRYFNVSESDNGEQDDIREVLRDELLSGIKFWRASIGGSFKW